MAQDDEDDDLYDEEFDFVDDDDDEDDEADDENDDEGDDDDTDQDLEDDEEEASSKNDAFGAGILDERPAPRAERKYRDEPRDNGEPEAARGDEDEDDGEEKVAEDEYGRTEPVANYVVHVYENRKLKRTIERAFTPEDAEAFATEFNRTSKNYSRVAVTGKNDAKPKKTLD